MRSLSALLCFIGLWHALALLPRSFQHISSKGSSVLKLDGLTEIASNIDHLSDSLKLAADQSILGLLKSPNFPTIPTNNVAVDGLFQSDTAKRIIEFIENNDYLKVLDAAKFTFLPEETKEILGSQSIWQRIVLGFLTIDVASIGLDVLILKQLRNAFFTPTLDINPTGLPLSYDAKAIASFYEQRPQVVTARFFEILDKSKDLLLGLLSDRLGVGKGAGNASERAFQLKELISELGPAFIKVGQAISVRPDILSPEYLEELVKLQDQVPPFDSSVAVDILRKELGRDPSQVFESMDAFRMPVAAASLGQVYKATLKSTGEEVAVKVQRPNMLVAVTLDLYIIRSILELGVNVESVAEECRSFIMVIDNWAGRFVDELDYVKEVQNSNIFRGQMEDTETTLGDAICVPKTFDEYCTGRILVSEWVVGTKLSAIDNMSELGRETKKKLLRTLLNSYLVQLLETGFLHADPHPGNFLITPEGKLCILDYGLMTEVAVDKRYALLEYVSHLLAKDYESTLEDLVTLEFIPEEIQNDPEKRDIVAPLLGQVLEQLSGGGGAAAINVQEMGLQVEELSTQYPIVIPAYFGLIVRAFGALEGIGLSIDPMYSITNECFPYLARRLLSDDSERVRNALKSFLYGRNGDSLDVDRVDELAKGFRAFTTAAAEAGVGNEQFRLLQEQQLLGGGPSSITAAAAEAGFQQREIQQVSTPSSSSSSSRSLNEESSNPAVDPALQEVVDILLSPQGNYVQDLLVTEAVRLTDALLRSISWTLVSNLRTSWGRSARNFQSADNSGDGVTVDRRSGNNNNRRRRRGLTPVLLPMFPLPVPLLLPRPSAFTTSRRNNNGDRATARATATTTAAMNLNQQQQLEPEADADSNLRRFIGPSPEDIQALRTLKRILEMFAGIPPTESAYSQPISGGSTSAAALGTSTSAYSSRGVIDQQDITLLNEALRNILGMLDQEDENTGMNKQGNNPRSPSLLLSPSQAQSLLADIQTILPLLQRAGPGLIALSRKFASTFFINSLRRIAHTLDTTKF